MSPEQREARRQYLKQYQIDNKDEIAAKTKARREEKREILREKQRQKRKDPWYKYYHILQTRLKREIYKSIENKNIGGMSTLFGCTRECFVQHIEKQFSIEMRWDNWGVVWQIDHILPLSLGKNNKDKALKLNHYTNLRPLLVEENKSKSDKIMPELINPNFPYMEDFKEQISTFLKC